MSILRWLLVQTMVMMMMMKNGVTSSEVIDARSGEAVLLTADIQEADWKSIEDIRWTHHHLESVSVINHDLLIKLKRNNTTCEHGRCEMLRNGSLRFSRIQAADSGNYSLHVFRKDGINMMTKHFQLRVEDPSSNNISSNSSNSNIRSSSRSIVPILMCCLILLLLLAIIFFIFMRRRNQRTNLTTEPLEENVYMAMHGNKKKVEEKKQEKEEESHYVGYNPVVSMETSSITQQIPADEEDIYV